MTRINCGIEPVKLTDQHLIAELRELPRIFTAVIKKIDNNIEIKNIPYKFKLGTGHVTFFYDKCGYLLIRHRLLRKEYYKRYNKSYEFNESNLDRIPTKYMNNYIPSKEDQNLLIERISIRISESKQIPRYHGKSISKKEAINLLY